ncbi:class I SAM-dependent methyltransferase [Deinococcus cavernae]|uniref:class I SAM-dependent methyltransferase n=1 Tax=Deinococcus cavernae TaxID=2320857 RepID=UPI001F46789B|nr:class I SAM-dependent methyltransferase [Deinococcus cavernae]
MPNAERFLGRAEVYAAARPSYPPELRDWLAARHLLGTVADIGAGTGLFTQLLLAGGARVSAVEPNPDMRAQLAARLAAAVEAGQLTVQDGTSEATGLPEQSVSLVTAAQAAHWFDPERTLAEFRRILTPDGRVLLVWNDWRGVATPFNEAYGQAVSRFYREGENPLQISRVPEGDLPRFMPGGHETVIFDNPLPLSRERLHGLASSISYLPAPGDPAHALMTAALDDLFAAHAHEQEEMGQQVTLHYRTHAFLGRV